ncbi:MAG: diphosphomevalonate decarboxylase [Acidobacteria bacterium]|nr:diphosphomevalonate decarboxylase [Acidobacteriota bacterium]
MTRECTYAVAPNIAFIKYWGATDLDSALPRNASISMTMSECASTTSVRCLEPGQPDEIWLAGIDGLVAAEGAFRDRALAHVERLREYAGVDHGLAVATRNNFPAAAGIASSASGFAALTVATLGALDKEVPAAELSVLARRSGSGSASRSVMGGYVQWPDGEDAEGPAVQLAAADHWDLRDVVVLVQQDEKKVSSLDGHRRAPSSPHFERRQELLPDRLAAVRSAIDSRDLAILGPVIEEDAIELHLIAMSSRPPIFYWLPASLTVLAAVRRLRDRGVEAWATLDAGANVHVICAPAAEEAVVAEMENLDGVHGVLRDRVGSGPKRLDRSLFAVTSS